MPSSYTTGRAASASSRAVAVAGALALLHPPSSTTSPSSRSVVSFASAKLADRGRLDSARKLRNGAPGGRRKAPVVANGDGGKKFLSDNGPERTDGRWQGAAKEDEARRLGPSKSESGKNAGGIRGAKEVAAGNDATEVSPPDDHHPFRRQLSSQLTGCCTNYMSYSAEDMCALYGQDCISGETPSHDSGDSSCQQVGLSFIGISFSVNTALGNPYSYQLCDQFPMENIIERNYANVMSMDEDGWLVGGGYKSFDHSGKMP
jgi:hypothetical protein